jgi:hypothetical protein
MPRGLEWTLAVAAALCVAANPALADTPKIGDIVAVKNEVTAETGSDTRKLVKGEKVFQNEILVTSSDATAEIQLLDKTKLAVGSSARIVLDKFIYDPNAPPGSISINLAKGAFRFITGKSPKTAYEIKTPTASMGVRGTVFDVFVADNGETVVLLHEGGVDVCATPTSCQRHDKVGHFLKVGLGGVLSAPLRWDGAILGGIAVTQAFPFVGKRLVIDPVRRLTHSALLGGKGAGRVLKAPGRAIKGIGRSIRRPRLPF